MPPNPTFYFPGCNVPSLFPWDLESCSLCFHLLRWDQKARGSCSGGECPLPVRKRFWKTLSPRVWNFIMEKSLPIFHNYHSSPLLPEFFKGSFSELHHKNPVSFSVVEPMKVFPSNPKAAVFRHFSFFSWPTLSLQQLIKITISVLFPFRYSYPFMATVGFCSR